jgi:hypothetical protein
MKLPVFKAYGGTFAVVFGNFLEMIKVLWLPMAALLGLFYFLGQRMFVTIGKVMEMQSSMETGQTPDPEVILHTLAPLFSTAGLIFLAELILIPMMFAGILRFVIRNEKPGLFYLRFGGDEFRILITFILVLLLFLVIYVAGLLVLALAAGLLVHVSPGAGGIVVAILGFAFFIFLIWLCFRLSLSGPAAVGARKIGIGPSWSATKGAAWSLFFYAILWVITFAILECAFVLIAMPGYLAGFHDLFHAIATQSGDPTAIQQSATHFQEQMMAWLGSHMERVSLSGFVFGLILYPLLIASGGVAYRYLIETPGEAA